MAQQKYTYSPEIRWIYYTGLINKRVLFAQTEKPPAPTSLEAKHALVLTFHNRKKPLVLPNDDLNESAEFILALIHHHYGVGH